MPADTSSVVYRCPVGDCWELESTRSGMKLHIREEHGKQAARERLPEELYPEVEPFDPEQVRRALRAEGPFEHGKIDYGTVAEEYDLPKGAVVYEALEAGLTPVYIRNDKSTDAESTVNTSWNDLTRQQKDTLLAHALLPELSHTELAEHPLSGHGNQGTISTTIRRHYWMLGHPEVDTPVEPEKELEYEGDETTVGAEVPEEEEPEPEPAKEQDPEHATGEEVEEAVEEEENVWTKQAGDACATLTEQQVFEAIVSHVEGGYYMKAFELFQLAVNGGDE